MSTSTETDKSITKSFILWWRHVVDKKHILGVVHKWHHSYSYIFKVLSLCYAFMYLAYVLSTENPWPHSNRDVMSFMDDPHNKLIITHTSHIYTRAYTHTHSRKLKKLFVPLEVWLSSIPFQNNCLNVSSVNRCNCHKNQNTAVLALK